MKNIGSFTKIQKTKQSKMNLNLMQESLLFRHKEYMTRNLTMHASDIKMKYMDRYLGISFQIDTLLLFFILLGKLI